MPVVQFPAGLAPDVVILPGGHVYVAFGTQSTGLQIRLTDAAGHVLASQSVQDGFYNSWPRFGGARLAYKRGAPSYGPSSLQVQTGEVIAWVGQVDGNFGLVVNESLGLVAYMNGSYPIWFGDFAGGAGPSGLNGKPDGLDTFVSRTEVTLRADTRLTVPGMQYPVRAGDLVVGEWDSGLGIACQLDGDELRIALDGVNSPTPRCATDGTTYAMVIGGNPVQLWLGSRADILALPTAESILHPPQPEPIPPEPTPIPPEPKPPIPPIPIPPVSLEGSCMQIFVTVDPSKVIAAKQLIPSKATPGCFNVILDDGSVFSAHGDTRPAGTDGPWEAGQQTGVGIMTFWADDKAWPYGIVLTDKLPK